MCEQCVAEAENCGEALPGWTLIRAARDGNIMKQGQWGLVSGNDPDYCWSVTPRPEPSVKGPEWNAWSAEAGEFERALVADPAAGYLLYSAALKEGYSPDSSVRFAVWLFARLGEHLAGRQSGNDHP